MTLIRIAPSRRASGPPEVKEFDIQAAATFPVGAPLSRDAVEKDIEEQTGLSTGDSIVGVAMVGVSSGVPAAKGSTAFGTRILVAIASRDTEFIGTMINATVVQTPNSGNDGTLYPLVKVSNEWYVDESTNNNPVVLITGFDAGIRAVWFKFIASVIGD